MGEESGDVTVQTPAGPSSLPSLQSPATPLEAAGRPPSGSVSCSGSLGECSCCCARVDGRAQEEGEKRRARPTTTQCDEMEKAKAVSRSS
jgi:hypothetical protein